jgi:hypothetical protein
MDPFVALAQNKDWTGKPIYIENRNSARPATGDAARSKDSATPMGEGVCGGDQRGDRRHRVHVPGGWSPTPDQIDYVIGQLTGEASGARRARWQPRRRRRSPAKSCRPYKIPLVGRLVREHGRSTLARPAKFYENINQG